MTNAQPGNTLQRLDRLRAKMTEFNVNAYIIPSEDAHQVMVDIILLIPKRVNILLHLMVAVPLSQISLDLRDFVS